MLFFPKGISVTLSGQCHWILLKLKMKFPLQKMASPSEMSSSTVGLQCINISAHSYETAFQLWSSYGEIMFPSECQRCLIGHLGDGARHIPAQWLIVRLASRLVEVSDGSLNRWSPSPRGLRDHGVRGCTWDRVRWLPPHQGVCITAWLSEVSNLKVKRKTHFFFLTPLRVIFLSCLTRRGESYHSRGNDSPWNVTSRKNNYCLILSRSHICTADLRRPLLTHQWELLEWDPEDWLSHPLFSCLG